MQKDQYRTLEVVQNIHWFYDHRRNLIEREILRIFPNRRDLKILDFGSGMGANIALLSGFGNVYCVEPEAIARDHLKSLTLKVYESIEDAIRESGETFDLVLVSYVLYHQNVAIPESTLIKLREITTENGALVSLEPAFESLKRNMDVRVHGARRFTAEDMRTVMNRSGWMPLKVNYLLPSLYPVAWLLAHLDRWNQKKNPGSTLMPIEQSAGRNRFANFIIRIWLNTADRWLVWLGVPRGIGVLTVAKNVTRP